MNAWKMYQSGEIDRAEYQALCMEAERDWDEMETDEDPDEYEIYFD